MEDGGSPRLNCEYPPPNNVMGRKTKRRSLLRSGREKRKSKRRIKVVKRRSLGVGKERITLALVSET